MAQPMRRSPGSGSRSDKTKLSMSTRAAARPVTPDPPRDPGGQWERAVRKLDPSLVEEWHARATAREYAGADRDTASALAFEDLAARCRKEKP